MSDRNQGTPFYVHPILDVQDESREWRAEAYPETRNIELQALGVCEEAGELAHAVLKYRQGIRGYDREKTRTEVADAIGDIFIYACGVADQLGINVADAVVAAWQHVKERNITQGSDAGKTLSCSRCGQNIGQIADGGRWFDNNGRVLCDPNGIMMHTPDPNALGARKSDAGMGPSGVGCFSPADDDKPNLSREAQLKRIAQEQ